VHVLDGLDEVGLAQDQIQLQRVLNFHNFNVHFFSYELRVQGSKGSRVRGFKLNAVDHVTSWTYAGWVRNEAKIKAREPRLTRRTRRTSQ
jgi:hypothetical protein